MMYEVYKLLSEYQSQNQQHRGDNDDVVVANNTGMNWGPCLSQLVPVFPKPALLRASIGNIEAR